MKMTECSECEFTDVRKAGAECPLCDEGTMVSADRFFIEVRGVSPEDFPEWETSSSKQDEAVSLANDIHRLLVEDYDKTDVTGVAPVVEPASHDLLSRETVIEGDE